MQHGTWHATGFPPHWETRLLSRVAVALLEGGGQDNDFMAGGSGRVCKIPTDHFTSAAFGGWRVFV